MGDGITQGALFTQTLLRNLGYESNIYAEDIPPELEGRVLPHRSLPQDAAALLLIHHSLGYDNDGWIWRLPQTKALVYHNITPESFWKMSDSEFSLSRLGRTQLDEWASRVAGAIGDSRINCQELRQAGYPHVAELPLLTDWQTRLQARADEAVMKELQGTFNILFVGRIAYNKRQDKLIDLFAEYQHFSNEPSRLILAGGTTSQQFDEALKQRIRSSGLENRVMMPGKVPAETLTAYYHSAHAFVCMSEHEGFGMPLIEAMVAGVPVIAAAHSAIPDTVSNGGFVLAPDCALSEVAALLYLIRQEPEVRARLRAQQRTRLQSLKREVLLRGLNEWLVSLGEQDNKVGNAPMARPAWQVEGPLIGSYSLAAVNRGIAGALHESVPVSLRLMDGGGDIPVQDRNWNDAVNSGGMTASSDLADIPNVGMRFCYPPRTDGLVGVRRWVHSYGWEETGFPANYASSFNRDLDGLTVLSRFVRKTLIDAGVILPIAVTGAGIDPTLFDVPPANPLPDEWQHDIKPGDFVFLHVSSCFPRKGVAELLAAWGRAFSANDAVVLVIKTFSNPHNTVKRDIEAHQAQQPHYPRVLVLEADLTKAQLALLYQRANAFVMPSRGEGLGLPAAEAMQAGLPVITVGWSGLKDFCNEATAYLCDYTFAYTDSHLGTEHSAWAVADIGHLARLMVQVHGLGHSHPKQAAARAAISRLRWSHCADALHRFHASLEKLPLIRPKPKVAVISTWNVRCGIAEYARHQIQEWPCGRVSIMAPRDAAGEATDGTSPGRRVRRNWAQNSPGAWQTLVDDCVLEGVGAALIQYNFGFYSLNELAALCEALHEKNIQTHVVFHSTADTARPEGVQRLETIAAELSRVTRIHVHGVGDLNRLRMAGLVDNATLIPHGVPVSGSAVMPNISTPVKRRIIASYGFALPHKGLKQLVGAFARLRCKDELQLRLVNAQYPIEISSREVSELRELIAELGIEKRVVLNHEFLTDEGSQALLQDADCIVFPYQDTQESASGAIRLALGMGIPVVTTPLPIFSDVRDVVHTLEDTTVEAIARGLQALLDDESLLYRHAERQKRWVAARAWPKVSERLLAIMDSVALNAALDGLLSHPSGPP